MLQIEIPSSELFDEINNEFIQTKAQVLRLEHSLVSISKWESTWCKPYLSSDKTNEQIYDYVRCMTLTQNVSPDIYTYIPINILFEIQEYINRPMTATWFSDTGRKSRRIITSELIYYWMIALNIPFECQKWHLNRLLTLIAVCNSENNPKKLSRSEIFERNRQINAQRRMSMKSKG